jgi:hypothetical protein
VIISDHLRRTGGGDQRRPAAAIIICDHQRPSARDGGRPSAAIISGGRPSPAISGDHLRDRKSWKRLLLFESNSAPSSQQNG